VVAAPVTPVKLLRFPVVRERTGLSRSTIWRLERRGEFPKHHRIAPNIVAWSEVEVSHWIEQRLEDDGSDEREPALVGVAHFERFAKLMMRFPNDVAFVRTVARAAFRAPDPIKAAEGFITDYDAVVTELTFQGAEPTVARSLASIASVGAEPLPTARKLLENFESVLRLAKRTHPSVARSVALSACRAADPLMTARLYMQNYDAIVKSVSRTDA
jgi:prophage regulatory protein